MHTGHVGVAYQDVALGGTAQGLAMGPNISVSAKGVVGVVSDAATEAAVGEELATPVGLAKLAFDGLVFSGALTYCSNHL